jgi:hypothetical protein
MLSALKSESKTYICLIKSFVNANRYYVEFSKSSTVIEQLEEQEGQQHKQEPQHIQDYKTAVPDRFLYSVVTQSNLAYIHGLMTNFWE